MEMAGDVISFHTFGKVIVVLNTANAAKDLLEKRSEIYSDRSVLPIHEMYVLEFHIQCAILADLDQDGMGLDPDICKKRRPLASRAKDA